MGIVVLLFRPNGLRRMDCGRCWLRLRITIERPLLSVTRGICPYAGTMIDTDISSLGLSAIVVTTVCDQMRYAAAMIENRGGCPVFLMNVPSTWQTDGVKKLYLDELRRLGRFLVDIGGKSPNTMLNWLEQ